MIYIYTYLLIPKTYAILAKAVNLLIPIRSSRPFIAQSFIEWFHRALWGSFERRTTRWLLLRRPAKRAEKDNQQVWWHGLNRPHHKRSSTSICRQVIKWRLSWWRLWSHFTMCQALLWHSSLWSNTLQIVKRSRVSSQRWAFARTYIEGGPLISAMLLSSTLSTRAQSWALMQRHLLNLLGRASPGPWHPSLAAWCYSSRRNNRSLLTLWPTWTAGSQHSFNP